MDSEKPINLFERRKDKLPHYLLNNYFVCRFVNNFLVLLLWKINFLDFYEMGDFFQIFVMFVNTEIPIELNYWLGMYVSYILNSQGLQGWHTPSVRP